MLFDVNNVYKYRIKLFINNFPFYIYIYIFIIIHVIPSLYAVVFFLMKLKKYHTDEQLTYNE